MPETTGGQDAGINEAVGTVSVLYGSAKAIAADGMVRVLSVNSPVFAFDRIVTDDDGSVTIALAHDPADYVEIDRASDVLIDEDVFGAAAPADPRRGRFPIFSMITAWSATTPARPSWFSTTAITTRSAASPSMPSTTIRAWT
ncbi:MAG: hypothetical protein JRJ72_07200 [Deltaproteobacteria bacterium]|nr:hypothetical protein [Deltaproteobacteria bacterium]